MTTNFWKDLLEEEVHLRDRFQFEIKSEFRPSEESKNNHYCQEFYLFIPEALQIHPSTYSRKDFYQDNTLFIRYKTPEISLKNILDSNAEASPFHRINIYLKDLDTTALSGLTHEVKLLANIVRSQLRHQIRGFINATKSKQLDESLISATASDIESIVNQLNKYEERVADTQLKKLFSITAQFIYQCASFYFTGLLEFYRDQSDTQRDNIDLLICRSIHKFKSAPILHEENLNNEETKAHHEHLLEKYFRDVLQLNPKRKETKKSYKNMVGAIAAGIAMYVYLFFFLWKVTIFDPQSTQFIILGVIFYILKDRVKEGVKKIFERYSPRFLSDQTTFLYDPHSHDPIGKVAEFFTFLNLKDVPSEIRKIRNQKFHEVLTNFIRTEDVIFFRKTIDIKTIRKNNRRRKDINSIFRYNIRQFLAKAGDSFYTVNELEPDSLDILKKTRHHVYHINVIMKSYFMSGKKEKQVQYKKFRLILDKEGLQRIENL